MSNRDVKPWNFKNFRSLQSQECVVFAAWVLPFQATWAPQQDTFRAQEYGLDLGGRCAVLQVKYLHITGDNSGTSYKQWDYHFIILLGAHSSRLSEGTFSLAFRARNMLKRSLSFRTFTSKTRWKSAASTCEWCPVGGCFNVSRQCTARSQVYKSSSTESAWNRHPRSPPPPPHHHPSSLIFLSLSLRMCPCPENCGGASRLFCSGSAASHGGCGTSWVFRLVLPVIPASAPAWLWPWNSNWRLLGGCCKFCMMFDDLV